MATTTIQPPWRSILLGAGLAVAIDIHLFVASIAIWYLSGSEIRSAVGAWVSLHEPALAIATELFPGPASAHSSLPLASYLGFGFLAFGQMAVLGGVLGGVYAVFRRRQSAL